MCGIAGIITNKLAELHLEWMENMLNSQKHRGPDNQQLEILSQQLVLGHNRLSIIDLSTSANQPFFSNDRNYCLVFNGEIYNYLELRNQLKTLYCFKTNSDSEVLLAAYIIWGPECLNKFCGMFAFAIYDQNKNEVFFARDRFGVKPLYYSLGSDRSILFASEIKSLHSATVPKEVNTSMWATFLTQGAYQFENQTFWKGIYQLNAGHYFTIDLRNVGAAINTTCWYDFVSEVQNQSQNQNFQNRTPSQHLRYYKTILESSIQFRFRSDVPVGINISGGLDSSILLNEVHRQWPETDIQAYTFYCNNPAYDELPWVEKLISRTGKTLNKVLLREQLVPVLANRINEFQDEPYGGLPTIAYSNLFKEAREHGVIVLLDGQGMDESWAGYDYYHTDSRSIVQGVSTSPLRIEVLSHEFSDKAFQVDYPEPFPNNLLNKQFRDLFYTKIPRALRFNDRISMMYSTELREPFLDHRLVEYAFALPVDMKIRDDRAKWGLRQLAEKNLGNTLALSPKRPVQVPQREWLAEGLSGWVEDHITRLRKNPWFEERLLVKSWNEFKSSNVDNSFFVWQWISVNMIGSTN